ncbi:MAG: hypothetical protein WAZ12_03250 [Candidatus Absconditicoccaceae bacterium]
MQEIQQTIDQKGSISNLYVPSSLEKKRAILMYLFFGIIIFIGRKEMSIFEYFHLRQALGWSVLFILFLILSLILFFLPVIKYLGLLIILIIISVWILFVLDAWKGKYDVLGGEKSPLALFRGIGEWIINLFEIQIKVYPTQADNLKEISSLEDLVK